MANIASGKIEITASFTYSSVIGGAAFAGYPKLSQSQSLDSTTPVNKVYNETGTISSPHTIDVSSLTDAYGAALAFGTVKQFVIQNTGAGNLVVGGGSNPLFGTDQFTVKSGATLPITSSFTEGAGAKNILLTPSASLSYTLIICGS